MTPARLRLDQLFAENNQEALDLHIQAFRLAEELSLPVMVCMDGFILTHAYERVDMPHAGRRSMPSCRPTSRARCSTRPSRCRIGAMVGPEAFMEVRYLAHAKQLSALELHSAHRGGVHGRASAAARAASSAPIATEDAETHRRRAGLGASAPIRTSSTRLRAQGAKIGACSRSRRSGRSRWPRCARRLQRAQRVVVLEKMLRGGPGRHRLDRRAQVALSATGCSGYTVIAGLGGRAITQALAARAVRRRGGRHARSR